MPIVNKDGIVREPPAAGISKLSELLIDVDKDWGGRVIKNLGAPAAAGDAIRLSELSAHRTAAVIDHPDLSITTAKLADASVTTAKIAASAVTIDKLYRTTDYIPMSVLVFLGGVTFAGAIGNVRIIESVPRADALVGMWWGDQMRIQIRFDTPAGGNGYIVAHEYAAAAADHQLLKVTAGSWTIIATEAVDLSGNFWTLGEMVGSTLKSFRLASIPTTPTLNPAANLSATDTSYASGHYGAGYNAYPLTGVANPNPWSLTPSTFAAIMNSFISTRVMSPAPKPIAYFEVPVVGSGTPDDPFRAQMHEEIVFEPTLKKNTNRLALTHSALIKSDPATGKPVEYRAIVRIFDQPDRQPHLRDIATAINALRAMKGVRELTREEAIREAKRLDDKLTDVDLMPIKRTDIGFRTKHRDYIAHRESLGVKRELIDDEIMERYLEEDKGWG